jgi:hypothetical protein
VLSCEPVKGDSLEFGEWSPEFGGSGSAGRRSWALARRPWEEQYSLYPAVSECSSQAARTRGL